MLIERRYILLVSCRIFSVATSPTYSHRLVMGVKSISDATKSSKYQKNLASITAKGPMKVQMASPDDIKGTLLAGVEVESVKRLNHILATYISFITFK